MEVSFRERVYAFWELTKPRIVFLLLFTEICAMVAATHRVPLTWQAVAAVAGLALTAGGSAALNMWYDRDVDPQMSRTADRPLPRGVVRPGTALVFALVLGVVGVLVLTVGDNPLSGLLGLGGYLYYGVLYTMILKRRTPQNIVIGGGAGAFPPLIGWAAMTGRLDLAPWLMFLLIFLWTPSHFWGLALYKREDYARASIPMMPVVRGEASTKRQMVVYAVLLIGASAVLPLTTSLGWLYAVPAAAAGLWFLWIHARLLGAQTEQARAHWAKRTFLASLIYLPVLFSAIALGALWPLGLV
ncbi:MAG: heme o synthase [Alicyclobacillus macrosporangiidus]|nr:heme o synthase [Alicyclobacillus macrosporangiidus]